MNGELAQMITLATHGSAWLRDQQSSLDPLGPTGTAFVFVRSLVFDLDHDPSPPTDAVAWLHGLRSRGVERLWLQIPAPVTQSVGGLAVPDHMLSGFAGAGRWFLAATGSGPAETWWASWSVGDQRAPDRRIWDVAYEGSRAPEGFRPISPTLAEAAAELRTALVDIEAFAAAKVGGPWSGIFQSALAALDDDTAELPYHPDLLPSAVDPAARRLLTAAATAAVFGGMGSWNDVGFADDADHVTHESLSAILYAAMLAAQVAGVNL